MFESYEDIFKKRARQYHKAMELCPQARAKEFSLAAKYLNVSPGMTVLDVPSGGGYLKQFVPVEKVNYIFVESSNDFASHCPVDSHSGTLLSNLMALPLLPQSADRILSLAAVHHIENKQHFFLQCFDLLKEDGLLVIGDVDAGSKMAGFLNSFVDSHNSMGHKGLFLSENIGDMLGNIGFEIVLNQYEPLFWEFESRAKAITFFRNLFGLDLADDDQILSGIEEYLGFSEGVNTMSINWGLRYLCIKPHRLMDE